MQLRTFKKRGVYMKKMNKFNMLALTKNFSIAAFTITALTSYAADNTQVYYALDQVRQARSALYNAESALVSALQYQNRIRTCRIKTTYIDYTGDGSSDALATSNARANCKRNGTQANVCDLAPLDICWDKN